MIIHDSKANPITEFVRDSEDVRSIPVILGHVGNSMNIDVQDLTAAAGFMLISLNGTDQWKHTLTNKVHIDWMGININPSSSYRGDVMIGFISGAAATTANLHILKTYHFDQAGNQVQVFSSFLGSHVECSRDNWFGPTVANDSTFGTSKQLIGPDGYMHFGTYNGDVVMKVTRTAGNVDIGLSIGYHTT